MHSDERALLPMGYFLTFNTYGTWLPGDDRGWCRRNGGAASLAPSRVLNARCKSRLMHPAVWLDAAQIETIHRAIVTTSAHRGWTLLALVVERAHVHVVVSALRAPEEVVRTLKSWATRSLRQRGDLFAQPVWSEHASTRYLHTHAEVERAVRYVLDEHHTPSGDL